MDNSQHIFSHITSVDLIRTPHMNGTSEARFKVHLTCACCIGHPRWVTRSQLVRQFGVSDNYLAGLEVSAFKTYKDNETKLQVEDLHNHLGFADITDFTDPFQIKDFEEFNFESEENVSDNATENESCSEDIESGLNHHQTLFG